MIVIQNIINMIPKDLKVYCIDVGQGDCLLVITPTNKKVLIDGGEGNYDKYDAGKNIVLPYLLARGITKLDYIVVSHFDSDHVGGLFAIIENLKVGKIFIGKQYESSEELKDLIKIANKKKVEIFGLESGNRLNIDRYVYFDVLFPDSKNMIPENHKNNNSLIVKLIYGEFSCLFTGDVEEIAEKKIVRKYENSNELNTDILKVAHHGSKTSTIEEFLKEAKPKVALISAGENNTFGHPNRNVLERLENTGCQIFRTDNDGEITIRVNRKGRIRIGKMLN